MPWTFRDHPTPTIVEVVIAGETTANDLRGLTSVLIAMEKEQGSNRFLIDTTEMEFAASIADIYALPNNQYEKEGADRRARVAVISSASRREKEAVKFYETACRNRGWMVQAFSAPQPAIEWLETTPADQSDTDIMI